jgi:hypothetical protein
MFSFVNIGTVAPFHLLSTSGISSLLREEVFFNPWPFPGTQKYGPLLKMAMLEEVI